MSDLPEATPLPRSQPPRILIVERGITDYLLLRKALVAGGPQGTWIDLADNEAEARSLVSGGQHDGIIVSSGLSGLQPEELLARLVRSAEESGAGARFFFLLDEDEPRSTGTRILQRFPRVVLLERPVIYEEVAGIVVDTLRPRKKRQLSYYNLRLLDLLRAYMLPGRSVTIRVLGEEGDTGALYIRDGRLVHAECGDATGVAAIPQMARITDGRIRLDAGCATARHSVRLPTEDLLQEAGRLLTAYRDLSFLRENDATLARASDAPTPSLAPDPFGSQRRGQAPFEGSETETQALDRS